MNMNKMYIVNVFVFTDIKYDYIRNFMAVSFLFSIFAPSALVRSCTHVHPILLQFFSVSLIFNFLTTKIYGKSRFLAPWSKR